MTQIFKPLVIASLLSGCMQLPIQPEKMSPEQLKEWAKDKNANINCGVVNSPYGRGVGISVILDKGLVVNGSVTVDPECKITINNSIPVKP